jgi:hypothetical protein
VSQVKIPIIVANMYFADKWWPNFAIIIGDVRMVNRKIEFLSLGLFSIQNKTNSMFKRTGISVVKLLIMGSVLLFASQQL